MGKLRPRLDDVRFHCLDCDYRFEAKPVRVEDAPEDEWHPWRYVGTCPECGRECEQERQQRGLLKAWAHATGPKTAEGLASTAKNLEGHPTPEEARRTRFNGLKHGLNARTATYWPARPGKYPDCDGCEYFSSCFTATACQKRVDLYFAHHLAFTAGDPKLLNDLNADLHANLRSIVNLMILDVIRDGSTIRTPAWYYDKDGGFHVAQIGGRDDDSGKLLPHERETIMVLTEHPMLKRIGEWVAKIGLSLSDMGMTPKAKEATEDAVGYLAGQQQRQESQLEYQKRTTLALEDLSNLIARSRENTVRDPVLIEHKQQAGENG
ncbi:MAG: hypothetical protein BGP10_12370 [Rhodanobacter sp. 68-29]|nr:zinc ribbon domain-containing protein [Rhodanobacter sp.]ODV27982.1 MAG: hypothetical protein ABT19_00290 [Rhodanobacter sp. SCN 68-63]OJY60686.1 MAG: hypothetical protein BGP10_12370 [Rhodanobacter sp. 68-29]